MAEAFRSLKSRRSVTSPPVWSKWLFRPLARVEEHGLTVRLDES
jgi:hypothetical protein